MGEVLQMKALSVFLALLVVFVTVPIAFYLQYQILKRVDATELMWFLFWVNVPITLLFHVVQKVAERSNG